MERMNQKDKQGPKVKDCLLGLLILWCKLWGEVTEEFHAMGWYGQMYILETQI